MEREQEQELGQARLPHREDQELKPFAGAPWLIVGALAVASLSLWWGERDERRALEAERLELLTSLESAHADTDRVRARIADEREKRRGVERRLAQSETKRVELEMSRRKLVDLVGELAAEANAERARDPDERKAVEAESRDARLADAKARLALARRLNHAFRTYGRAELRVHEVEGYEGPRLLGLRLLELDPDGVPTGLYRAASAKIFVERSTGTATLLLDEVTRTIGGVRHPTDKEWKIHFELEEPRAFVAELGTLVTLKGAWPTPARREKVPLDRALETQLWKERFDAFLESSADDSLRYRLQQIGRVQVPTFYDVEILGFTVKGRWEQRIRAKRVEVFVDRAKDRVELLLRDGFIESARGKLDLPKDRDYRMHLKGLRAESAERALLGFVKRADG